VTVRTDHLTFRDLSEQALFRTTTNVTDSEELFTTYMVEVHALWREGSTAVGTRLILPCPDELTRTLY
jgi:hypothetical protein